MKRALLVLAAALSTQCAMVLGFEEHEPFPPGSSVAFAPPVVLATGQRGPLGIASDATRVYFVGETGNTLAVVEKRPGAPLGLLAQDLRSPRFVAVDDVRVYVGQAGGCGSYDSDGNPVYDPPVFSILKDGTSRVAGASYNCGDNLTTMSLSDSSVIGVRSGAEVLSWPTNLASVSRIAEPVDGIASVAARGADVFFTNATKGTVNVVTPPSQAVVAFATNQPSPQDITLDDTFAYWLNGNGSVMKLARATPSVPPEALATAQPTPKRITQFGDNVYFTCGDGTVRLVPKAGGEVRVIASGQASPTGIAADTQGAYWTNRGDDTVMMALRR